MNVLTCVWYMVTDLFATRNPELFIDPKRINDEVRVERRRYLDDDAAYRDKVKKRMVEGLTARELPPLIDRASVLKARVRRRRKNIVGFRFKEGSGGQTTTKP